MDDEVPKHLYDRLPGHMMTRDKMGREVPDYLKMILMCELEGRRKKSGGLGKERSGADGYSKDLCGTTEAEGDTFDAGCQPLGEAGVRGELAGVRSIDRAGADR